MKSLTAYIVDDEPLANRMLKKKLGKFPEIDIIGESTRMAKAVSEINTLKPDLLFLDIQLTEGTGFDLLEKVNFTGKLVFVTAFDEYAFRAFEINAVDYLLKPISDERLTKTISRILEEDQDLSEYSEPTNVKYRYSDRILVVERSQIRFILLESVTLISAARDYSTIVTIDGKKSLILRSITEWVNRLPHEHFIRIHRSYIVNMNHIEKIVRNSSSSAQVHIKNHPDPVSLSRTFYGILREKYS